MINIKKFEQALKESWVRKFLSSSDSQWYRLLKKSYGNPDKILSFGEDFSNLFLINMANPFWHNVINNWIDIHHQIPIRTNNEILQTCIWYNSQNIFPRLV